MNEFETSYQPPEVPGDAKKNTEKSEPSTPDEIRLEIERLDKRKKELAQRGTQAQHGGTARVIQGKLLRIESKLSELNNKLEKLASENQ